MRGEPLAAGERQEDEGGDRHPTERNDERGELGRGEAHEEERAAERGAAVRRAKPGRAGSPPTSNEEGEGVTVERRLANRPAGSGRLAYDAAIAAKERTMERIGVVGLGTMGGAMAANLARAGFPVGGLEPHRRAHAASWRSWASTLAASPAALAADVDIVLVCVSDTPDVEAVLFGADGVADGAAARNARHRLLHDRPSRQPRLRGPPGGAGDRLRGRARHRRQRGGAERDAGDPGRRRAGRRRAGPPRPRGDRPDDHPLRPGRRGPGGQGRQPGDPRRHLPRRGGGPRAGVEGGPRPRSRSWRPSRPAPPRAGSSRTGAGACSPTTTRSASGWRSTSRTWGSPSRWPARREPRSPWPPWPPSSRPASWRGGHADDDMSALARTIRSLSGLDA